QGLRRERVRQDCPEHRDHRKAHRRRHDESGRSGAPARDPEEREPGRPMHDRRLGHPRSRGGYQCRARCDQVDRQYGARLRSAVTRLLQTGALRRLLFEARDGRVGRQRTKGVSMAMQARLAIIGAATTIVSAIVTGYFSVQVARSSGAAQEAQARAQAASSEAANSSAAVAVGAVDDGYRTTVKPLFDETANLIASMQDRMDLMAREIRELRAALSSASRSPL